MQEATLEQQSFSLKKKRYNPIRKEKKKLWREKRAQKKYSLYARQFGLSSS